MFIDENKMGGLKLLFESANIDIVTEWGRAFYGQNTVFITRPEDGARFFVEGNNHYSSLIIQENKRYKVYG